MTGCIEKAPPLSQAPSPMAEHQLAEELPSSLQVDFDAEVSSSLFRVRGNIMVPGNASIPFLLLNATLSQGGLALQSTEYMLMDVEPGGDHGFEISKNMKISPGSYNCTLDVAGPKESLACETRRCKTSIPWTEPSPVVNLLPEAASKKAEQKAQEDRKEKIQEEAKEVAEEGRALSKASSEEAAPRKEDSQAENASQENDSSSQAGASLKASSTLSSGQEGMFAGSSTSKKYHRLDCRYSAKIKPENKIYFSGEEDARQQGYLPCKTCNP